MSDELLKAALEYAGRGWAIFPCRFNKKPYIDAWPSEATTDAKQIKEWWAKWPAANIGLDTSSMLVVDFDPGSSLTTLRAAVPDLPATNLRQRTPRGGSHWFYSLGPNERVANSSNKVAPHVDVRGFHGYVLLAPSRTENGSYTWESEGKPAYRTNELLRQANIAKQKHKERDTWLIEPDLPENIAAATEWLKTKAKPAIEGQGGDHATYAAAAMCKSFGLSGETAIDVLYEYYNPRCNPPWDYDALATKVVNAYEYNTSPPGNVTEGYKLALSRQLFKPVDRDMGAVVPQNGKDFQVGRFRLVDRHGMADIRPPKWLIPDFLPEGSFSVLVGAPRSFKSFVALDIALSVASGFPVNPVWEVASSGPVLYMAGEGFHGIGERVKAWEDAHWAGAKVEDFWLMGPVPGAAEELKGFCGGLLEAEPRSFKLVVVDTIGRSMQGLNENAQEHASKFTRMVEMFQQELGCCVLALHHTGHDGDRAKGSMEFFGAPDTVVTLRRTEEKSMKADLTMSKQKDAAEWDKPRRLVMGKAESGSLYVASMEQAIEAKPEAAELSAQTKKAADLFKGKVTAEILDKALRDILESNPSRAWGQNQLAEAMAMHEAVELSSSHLKNRLVALREDKGSYAHGCYDPAKKEWRAPR